MKAHKGSPATLLRRLVEWLNKEPPPIFSLDPAYPPVETRDAAQSGSDSRGRGAPGGGAPEGGPGAVDYSSGIGRGIGVSSDLDSNLSLLGKALHIQESADVVVREFSIGGRLRAALVFIEGMVDRRTVNADILQPLLDPATRALTARKPMVERFQKAFPAALARPEGNLRRVVSGVMNGSAAVLIDGMDCALLVDATGVQHRPVAEPSTERVVLGPHEAFVESLKVNVPLVRRILKTPDLVCSKFEIGDITKTQVIVFHIEGIANPRLVREVKRRISSIKVDYMAETGLLDQLIDVPRFGLVPHALYTERPDRLAAHLAEGYVGIMVDHSPYGLIVPATILTFFHSAEDYYVRWPAGTLLRLIRMLALFTTILLPGLYVSVVNYHHEMLPTTIAWAFAASRESVPIPSVGEVLIAEIALDFIREAGVRVPSPVGPTIGIVGALLIGEAAVNASLLTPEVVIVVAITAICNFIIPNQDAAFFERILRYLFAFAASLMGFLGLAAAFFVIGVYLCSLRSFGVPFMAPLLPFKMKPDTLVRGPVQTMETRPDFLRPATRTRQLPISRGWPRQRWSLGGWRRQGAGRRDDNE